MRAQKILFIFLITSHLAFGQEATSKPADSTDRVIVQPNLQLLPLWTPPKTTVAASNSDSLVLPVLSELSHTKPLVRLPRWLGVGMIIAGSSLSYMYHQQAEEAYQDYLRSGNPGDLDQLYSRAERLDRLSGWSFIGAEAGLLLVSMSVIFSP